MSGEHAYAVTVEIIQNNRFPLGAYKAFRAWCPCGATFKLRRDEAEAARDGLDHVRQARGTVEQAEAVEAEAAPDPQLW